MEPFLTPFRERGEIVNRFPPVKSDLGQTRDEKFLLQLGAALFLPSSLAEKFQPYLEAASSRARRQSVFLRPPKLLLSVNVPRASGKKDVPSQIRGKVSSGEWRTTPKSATETRHPFFAWPATQTERECELA